MFEGTRILITGGTGSWGQQLAKRLLRENPEEIRVLSRNEFALVTMERSLADPRLTFLIGDVRDLTAVGRACENVDYVFHLAALKHVPICERQPEEAIQTNIKGTENVIRACIASRVKKVVDVSTDKAVDPINLYGMTKAVGEKLVIHADTLSPFTRFFCIRGGNVLGTNGSVVPMFREQILNNQVVTLTSRQMTRFLLTQEDAIERLLQSMRAAIGGEIFVMNMKSCRMVDLVEILIERLANQQINVREIGVRPGEKLHEVLVSASETARTRLLDENLYVILPATGATDAHKTYHVLPSVSFDVYESGSSLMSRAEAEQLLEQGGFCRESE